MGAGVQWVLGRLQGRTQGTGEVDRGRSANHKSEAAGRRGRVAGELGAWRMTKVGAWAFVAARLCCEAAVYTYERALVPLSDGEALRV